MWEFQLFHFSTNTCNYYYFNFSHSCGSIEVSHCGCIFYFPDAHLFICLMAIRTTSIVRCLFKSFAHFLNRKKIYLLLDIYIMNIFYQHLVSFNLSIFVSCGRNICLLQSHKYVLYFLCTFTTVIYNKLFFVYSVI